MDFGHFSPAAAELGPPLEGSYNSSLLLLSIAIACFAGLAALAIVNRIIASEGPLVRARWLAAGAVAMGCGIWAMHFTGMLAFSLPIEVRYELRLTLWSLVPGILASGAALYFIAQPKLGWWRLQTGALLMAAGIGAMHYAGMAGMHIQGVMNYNFFLFCLSLAVAHLLSMAAIYIRFMVSARFSLPAAWMQPAAGVVMGTAVAGMHYTAMGAARFYAGPEPLNLVAEFSNLALGSTISGFSILILSLAMLATLVDRRITETEQRRRIEEARANTILNTTADGILALDGGGRILSCNPAAEFMFGYSLTEIIDQPVSVLVPEFCLPSAASRAGTGAAAARCRDLREVLGRRADGSVFPLEISMNSVPEAGSEIVVISLRDMTERQRALEAIQRTEERLKIVTRATTDAIWDWDLITDMVWWNEGIQTLFGYQATETEPHYGAWTARIHPDDRERVMDDIRRAIEGDAREWSAEYRFIRRNGSIAHVYDRGFVIRDDNGRAVRMVGGMSDVTLRKQAEAEIEYLAFYDSLTRLPNRLLLLDRLEHALAACGRNDEHGGLVFLDLDAFKTLNDTFGHNVGDQLLKQVALRLRDCTRGSDTVARLGGDEFVVVLEKLSAEPDQAIAQARSAGEKILRAFQQPFVLDGHEHYSTASMGLTLFSDQRVSVDELLKQADIAMYQAKADGGNTLRFFDPRLQARVNARVELETQLRRALQHGEFVLHYQPQVDDKGRVRAAEALVRWRHPRQGLLLPADFLAVAEEAGLIHPLGNWILETACRQLKRWEGRPETAQLTLAVNVSAQQVRHPEFVDQVLGILARSGANTRRLKLELTENVLVSHMEETIGKMSLLKSRGVGFSLDDFGTGYSSLYYLKRLPLDQLKIDQSFVKDVLDDTNDAAIAQMIIALASLLGLSTVAEGVETMAQRDFLVRLGCRIFQGFLFSEPLPIADFERLLERGAGGGAEAPAALKSSPGTVG